MLKGHVAHLAKRHRCTRSPCSSACTKASPGVEQVTRCRYPARQVRDTYVMALLKQCELTDVRFPFRYARFHDAFSESKSGEIRE